jgi:hypothetical protein
MEEWAGVRKFGANDVKFHTPLTNLRITTFVCNETEVKVIDPNKLEVVETEFRPTEKLSLDSHTLQRCCDCSRSFQGDHHVPFSRCARL